MQDAGDTDIVTEEWIRSHQITIPRAAGVFQSPTAWVKINGHGTIIAAGERDQTVLAWLVERNTLCDTDADYAVAYFTCRSAERAYRRQMGYKSSLDLTTLSGGGSLSCEQAAMVFSLICRALGKERQVIEYACDTIRVAGLPNYQPDYRKAFNALAKAFDQAVRDVREGNVSMEPQPRSS
jgi:hypothetical protein